MPRRIKAQILLILFAVAAMSGVAIFGCDSDWAIWAIRSDTADPLYRFVEHGKAGYIDQTGKVVIPPRSPSLDIGVLRAR